MKLHIFGSSGSGTTSLGRRLSKEFDIPHYDSDDYYWQSTDPPYQERRSVADRQQMLLADLANSSGWIVSGSLDTWSHPIHPLFSAVIFVSAEPGVRAERLRRRELHEFGDRIKEGGDMHADHEYFVRWAYQYDEGALPGRSRRRHEEWLKLLTCPILRLTNNGCFDDLVSEAKHWLVMQAD